MACITPAWSSHELSLNDIYIIEILQEIIKFIHFVLATKVAKFAKQWLFCLSFSCNVIVEFKKTLKSDWLFCFTVPFSLDGKKMRFRAENGAIWE